MLARILYKLAHMVMRAKGWRFAGETPTARKCILLGAPHTSNWDFILTLALIHEYRLRLNYMIKDSVFVGPFGWLVRSLGGIPIDRSRRSNMVDKTVEAFKAYDDMIIGILPEGTRKKTDYWKSGFYHIAYGASVPLYPVRVDGPGRTLTIGPRFDVSGDIVSDMEKLAQFFGDAKGILPENSGPVRVRIQDQAEAAGAAS